ncbi:hypothetical protein GOB94_14970 [Granulicella sp. 5B5]|nr:hypothetical protein GOB94_14970 [Granulicella sp. 5B5]
MIQRHQRIVFWCLVACIVAMTAVLVVERQRARDRVLRLGDQMPLDAPTATTEPVTMDFANDNDGEIHAGQREIALPTDTTARARALIDHLIAQYSQPGSAHPLQPGAAVNEVFLVPLPVVGYTVTNTPSALHPDRKATVLVAPADGVGLQPRTPGGELAVVDLRSSFVDQHPSGVEVESLTLRSIIGTLHANLPQIEQVRFLVDGASREALAGHADLMRTYRSRDTATATDDGGGN